jgi:hypothetical protein
MLESVANMGCPAVPLSGSGTAGQPTSETELSGTETATGVGTTSLKALAFRLLERDKARDTGRDSKPLPSVRSVPLPGQQTGRSGTVLSAVTVPACPVQGDKTTNPLAILDSRELPVGLFPACGNGMWWRVSILSGGPGQWTCERCSAPGLGVWVDACAVPTANHTAPKCSL